MRERIEAEGAHPAPRGARVLHCSFGVTTCCVMEAVLAGVQSVRHMEPLSEVLVFLGITDRSCGRGPPAICEGGGSYRDATPLAFLSLGPENEKTTRQATALRECNKSASKGAAVAATLPTSARLSYALTVVHVVGGHEGVVHGDDVDVLVVLGSAHDQPSHATHSRRGRRRPHRHGSKRDSGRKGRT